MTVTNKLSSADHYLSSLLEKARPLRKPVSVSFELTYACNFSCKHCYNPTHHALPDELSTNEILLLLKELSDFGVAAITFTGGELFARPDLFAILEEADRLGFLINLITNASLIKETDIVKLKTLRILNIHISVYGATPETYEQVTQKKDAFDRFRDCLNLLISNKLRLNIRMPVMTLNAHEAVLVKDWMASLGQVCKFTFDMDPKSTRDLSPLAYRLPPEEIVRIKKELFTEDTWEPVNDTACFERGEFIECGCGRNKFAITPDGMMNLCTAFPIPRYDLKTGSLAEGWEILKRTVDHARPDATYACIGCEVRLYCHQGRNDAWLETGNMSSCLPHFKKWAELEKPRIDKQLKEQVSS